MCNSKATVAVVWSGQREKVEGVEVDECGMFVNWWKGFLKMAEWGEMSYLDQATLRGV